jgi:hypothetical protein
MHECRCDCHVSDHSHMMPCCDGECPYCRKCFVGLIEHIITEHTMEEHKPIKKKTKKKKD